MSSASPAPSAVAAPPLEARRAGDAAAIRAIDVAGALLGLLLFAPLMLLIAILVRLDSPGPALFRHRRVGLNRRRRLHEPRADERRTTPGHGQPFVLYKFRSMRVDARERFPELYSYSYTDEELQRLPIKLLVGLKPSGSDLETLVAARDYDPRITRVGHWLRRTSLDELPNFWNVLIGDMHLVGPRPDIEENIRYYLERHLPKFDVKPGITGLAQISGRGMLSLHETNEYDVRYAESCTLQLDLRILFRTLKAAFTGAGAF